MDDRYARLRPAAATPVDELCSCSLDTPIKLMTTAGLGSNPIHCLRCNHEVRPETLPLTNGQIQGLAHWQQVHGAIEALELDSGAYESWARERLLDPSSSTNV
jgi:hypothetical protein